MKQYFIDLMPYEKTYLARENSFKYDKIFNKWFTYDADHELLKETKRKDIDFYKVKKDNILYYDNETTKNVIHIHIMKHLKVIKNYINFYFIYYIKFLYLLFLFLLHYLV